MVQASSPQPPFPLSRWEVLASALGRCGPLNVGGFVLRSGCPSPTPHMMFRNTMQTTYSCHFLSLLAPLRRHKGIKIWKRKRPAARIPGVSGGMARSRPKVGDCLADSDVATRLHIRLTKRLGLLFCAVASRHGPTVSGSRSSRSH